MKSNNRGFTLIELVIVIVILGILAVTASPRFLDLQGDARAATVEGVQASLAGAVNIAHSKALIQGVNGTNATPASTTNPAIPMVFAYPEALANIETTLLDVTDADWNTFLNAAGNQVRIFPAAITIANATAAFANDVTQCYVQYDEATSAADNGRATVTSQTGGC